LRESKGISLCAFAALREIKKKLPQIIADILQRKSARSAGKNLRALAPLREN
jgi:hypothetical protein